MRMPGLRRLYDSIGEPGARLRVPECGYRCNACMGTNTVVSREQLRQQAQRIAEMEEASREHEGRI